MSTRSTRRQWFTWSLSVLLIAAGAIGLMASLLPEPFARLKNAASNLVAFRAVTGSSEPVAKTKAFEPVNPHVTAQRPSDDQRLVKSARSDRGQKPSRVVDGESDAYGRELGDDEIGDDESGDDKTGRERTGHDESSPGTGPVRIHGMVSETDGDEPFVSGKRHVDNADGDAIPAGHRGLDPATMARNRGDLLDDNDFSRTAVAATTVESEPDPQVAAKSLRSGQSRSSSPGDVNSNGLRSGVALSANLPKSVNGGGRRRRDPQLLRDIRTGLDDTDGAAGDDAGANRSSVQTVGFDDEAPAAKGLKSTKEKRDSNARKPSPKGDEFGLDDPADVLNGNTRGGLQKGSRVGANRNAELDGAASDRADPEAETGTTVDESTFDEHVDTAVDPRNGKLDENETDRTPLRLLLKGNKGKARTIAASGKPAPTMSVAEIQKLVDAGELYEAQRQYSLRYWQFPEERGELATQLETIGQDLFFSPQPHFEEPYVVKPGDQLRVLAQRYHLSWDYLAKLNRTEPRKLRSGQRLKVVHGPFSAIVSISDYELIVHLQGVYVRSYKVGVGKAGSTPIGEFVVKNKLKNPTYYGPDGVIGADAEDNPLGERWIDIGDSYGIHGTVEPESIGKSESRGCIRMLNEDVEEVYDLLTIGSVVKIQK